jgi:hypothetical protein
MVYVNPADANRTLPAGTEAVTAVKILDLMDVAAEGATVHFTATSGSLDYPSAVSGPDGVASVVWTTAGDGAAIASGYGIASENSNGPRSGSDLRGPVDPFQPFDEVFDVIDPPDERLAEPVPLNTGQLVFEVTELVVGPELISPTEGEIIEQNRDDIGCSLIPWHQGKGYGFEIEFDWSDVPGAATYELETWREGSDPVSITVDGLSSYTSTECNTYVIDDNLQGWMWRVRALHELGDAGPWSESGMYQFAPCRLSDGSACVSPPLSAPRLYGVNSADDGLSTIYVSTGNAVFIGRLGGSDPNKFVTPVAMAIRPSDSQIFVWNNSDSDGSSRVLNTGVLLTVDACSGVGTPVNPSAEVQGQMNALAFHPNGTLYGIGLGTGGDRLFEINTVTGEKITDIGLLGLGSNAVFGADFASDGTLYGLSSDGTQLVTINTTTGAATVAATLSPSQGVGGSIVFDPTGDFLLGTSPEFLFDIDITTGAISNVRSVSAFPPQGMGFAPGCSP